MIRTCKAKPHDHRPMGVSWMPHRHTSYTSKATWKKSKSENRILNVEVEIGKVELVRQKHVQFRNVEKLFGQIKGSTGRKNLPNPVFLLPKVLQRRSWSTTSRWRRSSSRSWGWPAAGSRCRRIRSLEMIRGATSGPTISG